MRERPYHASVTRISDLRDRPYDVTPFPREEWGTGDYVVAEVTPPLGRFTKLELPSGRMIDLVDGDYVIGALGQRAATLEAVGDWRFIGSDGMMNALTSAGLFGLATHVSYVLGNLTKLAYRGHVVRDGQPVKMAHFVPVFEPRPFRTPVILVIGTSMSAGKTTAARVVVRQLKKLGRRVVGAKITGAARYRDILSMHDSGADRIVDFVDAGLPSSITDEDTYRAASRVMLGMIDDAEADIAVVEAGASPLEPYNGQVALEELGDAVQFTILCASDPYAVAGVMQGFGFRPDLVAGLATATPAGTALVGRLADVPALDLLDPASVPELVGMLRQLPRKVDEHLAG
ncbi:MAG TPA: hypothetical protein VLD62_10890 [Acidimicrobiia bacterium]|nr:hypothetical protein [Acidimicrobiia bacterium]